jgi:serine/threonine protein kinase
MFMVHLLQTIKIGDFGMSRFVGADSVATATGRRTLNRNLTIDIIGTAHYASPEMLNDELLVRHPLA